MNSFDFKYFSSVDLIEEPIWDALACSENIYYTPDFLRAFEAANADIDFTYILVMQNEKPVAFANTQIVTIGIETITKNIKINEAFKNFINRLLRHYHIRVMFCGNVFLSGEYGTFLCQDEDKIQTFKAIGKAVTQLARTTKPLNAIFVKDFKNESLYITDQLKGLEFTPMHVEPNMMIHLDPDWTNFDDFKSALKSKYRVKANKADSQSAALQIKTMEVGDILNHKDQLQNLYENTITNANFNAQVLNLDTYILLKSTYPERFFVRGYFLEEELVGFMSAMVNGDHLDAHFIGLNYKLNRQFAIYPRILNDYVRLGISCKASQINLGRTASEIKSTLGAVPEELTCYIRHKYGIPNKLMRPFIKSVKIKTYRQHQPFKKKKEAKIAS